MSHPPVSQPMPCLEVASLSQPCTLEIGDCIVEITELEGYVQYLDRTGHSAPGLLCSTDGTADAANRISDIPSLSTTSDPGSHRGQLASKSWLSRRSLFLHGRHAPFFSTRELRISSAGSDCSVCNLRENCACAEDSPGMNMASDQNVYADMFTAANLDRKVTSWFNSIRDTVRKSFGGSGWCDRLSTAGRCELSHATERSRRQYHVPRTCPVSVLGGQHGQCIRSVTVIWTSDFHIARYLELRWW